MLLVLISLLALSGAGYAQMVKPQPRLFSPLDKKELNLRNIKKKLAVGLSQFNKESIGIAPLPKAVIRNKYAGPIKPPGVGPQFLMPIVKPDVTTKYHILALKPDSTTRHHLRIKEVK